MKKAAMVILLICGAKALSGDSLTRSASYRKPIVWSANIGIPLATYGYLYKSWYSRFEKVPFRFVNDNHHWGQIDKAGHAFSAYFIAVNSAASFRWAGYPTKKSALIGSGVSLGFQYAIELFDGHSSGWGASPGDLIANTAGTLFGGYQAYHWGEVKIPLCITFQPVTYAGLRPELLGMSFLQHKLKDYNSQTYWLNLFPEYLNIRPQWWPRWLGVSAGYGINGFLGAESNRWTSGTETFDYSAIPRVRQFYISPAISLRHLKSKNKLVRTFYKISGHWKFPLPAIEFNSAGAGRFHWIYW